MNLPTADSLEGTGPRRSHRPLPRTTLRDAVAEEIRRRVFSAALPPGSRVDQEALAHDLGVSRVPVREALITLHDEGIVENIARRGAFVALLSRLDIHDNYRILGMVSGLAAERAAGNLTAADLARLRDLADRMESSSAPVEQERLNFEFHALINRAAGSRKLVSVLRMLVNAVPDTFYESHSEWPDKANHDHRRIIEMLATGNSDGARREIEQHFADGADRAVASLEQRGFWSGVRA
ncbi:MAG: GntR family transcriptional regulator [Marmoricola sp.]|nr:GntR family transcriptional regulator [Marmoricola sp.]